MFNFYLARLASRPVDLRQQYLDETVAAKFRAEVKDEWNRIHPDEPLE